MNLHFRMQSLMLTTHTPPDESGRQKAAVVQYMTVCSCGFRTILHGSMSEALSELRDHLADEKERREVGAGLRHLDRHAGRSYPVNGTPSPMVEVDVPR